MTNHELGFVSLQSNLGLILCRAFGGSGGQFAAWSLYKLEQRGWWAILIAVCLMIVSAMVTLARHDLTEMYHLMGYPEAQIEQIQKMGSFTGNRMEWFMSLCMLPFLGYLLFIRKHLPRT